MPFRITVDGQSMLTEDFTLNELEAIEGEVGRVEGEDWTTVIFAPMKTRERTICVLKYFFARHYGMEEATKRAREMTFRQALDAFEVVEDDRPKMHQDGIPVVDPKAETAEPVTTSSS